MSERPTDEIFEANAYAVAYRLLGDRPAAHAASAVAAERLRRAGGLSRSDWLYQLVELTLEQITGPGAPPGPPPSDEDPFAGLRTALRRRLARAAPDQRVAGSLVHLAGYPVEMVAGVVGRPPDQTADLASIVAPPPGVAYRDLGDPELIGAPAPERGRRRRRLRRPHWTTLAALALVVAAVVAATQVTGPRPTLGPAPEEGGLGNVAPPATTPDQRNGGPLTQLTNE